MTTIFVSAVDGSNADNGTTWALAKQTVAGALAIAATGDTIVVDNLGTFTANATITWTVPTAARISIISVTRSGTVSFTKSAGAIEAVGASSSNFNIQSNATSGSLYTYGMIIKGGTNNNVACNIGIGTNAVSIGAQFESCTFDLPTANDRTIFLGGTSGIAAASLFQFLNCTFLHSVTGTITQYFDSQNGICEIINPTFTFSATMPTQLIGFSSTSANGYCTIRDGDISGFSGTAIVLLTSLLYGSVTLENLKLHATPTITGGSWTAGVGEITIRNCDSADTTYTFQYLNAFGILTADETIYITTGGTQFDGAGVSWKVVTTSLANENIPFRMPKIFIWDTVLTSQTAEIEFIRDSATSLTDRDIWSDLDSAASTSFPNYTFQTNRNANPFTGTPANQPTSTNSWTGTGGFTNPNKQKLQNTFTAAAAGLLQSRISIGKASETIYFDAQINGVG
jgi:hypothetical protein